MYSYCVHIHGFNTHPHNFHPHEILSVFFFRSLIFGVSFPGTSFVRGMPVNHAIDIESMSRNPNTFRHCIKLHNSRTQCKQRVCCSYNDNSHIQNLRHNDINIQTAFELFPKSLISVEHLNVEQEPSKATVIQIKWDLPSHCLCGNVWHPRALQNSRNHFDSKLFSI